MTWVRLDDQFYDNPRNRALGPSGRDLFVAGLCYCNKGLTDGTIAKADLPLLLAQAQAKRSTVQVLVDAGRWVEHDDHYQVDNYLKFQPSRAKVLADRAAAAERALRSRARAAARKGARSDARAVAPSRPEGSRDGECLSDGDPAPSAAEVDPAMNVAKARELRQALKGEVIPIRRDEAS